MKTNTPTAEDLRKRVAAHKARQKAAGRVAVNAFLSADTVDKLDQMKAERGASSRAPLIEEAVRFYFENMRA